MAAESASACRHCRSRAASLPVAVAAAAVAGGAVVTAAAALLPAQALRRMPAARLLAEE